METDQIKYIESMTGVLLRLSPLFKFNSSSWKYRHLYVLILTQNTCLWNNKFYRFELSQYSQSIRIDIFNMGINEKYHVGGYSCEFL